DGYYRVMMSDGRGLAHELHIAPSESDWNKPWDQQRMRLLGVLGWSSSAPDAELVYKVTMKAHEVAHTAKPIVGDVPGLDEDVAPSGRNVDVELPKMIHVEVPSKKADVIFMYSSFEVNPPLYEGVFQLKLTPGVPIERAVCD